MLDDTYKIVKKKKSSTENDSFGLRYESLAPVSVFYSTQNNTKFANLI